MAQEEIHHVFGERKGGKEIEVQNLGSQWVEWIEPRVGYFVTLIVNIQCFDS